MRYQETRMEMSEKAFRVDKATCPICGVRTHKVIDNRSLLDGSMTFHIIKLKCSHCRKEYLDLEQAEVYDLFLTMSRHLSRKPLTSVSKMLAKAAVS